MERCPYCASPIPSGAAACPACGMGVDVQGAFHLLVGTKLKGGRYTLGKVLGQGGFGITYLGADTQKNRPVAIKELFPEGSTRDRGTRRVVPPTALLGSGFAETMESFEGEARLLSRFKHPGIVRVYDIFEENGTAYLVMEFLKGQTLGKRLEKQGRLPPGEVERIARKLLEALEVVHKAGLLHRDIKPDNVFLHQDGRVVLIDFGSARQFARGKTQRHTRLVTPGYAPLEQYGTEGRFGPYTDLYALGATLYHALTGAPPPAATDRIQKDPPLRLPPDTPPGLEQAIRRALEIRVDRRPQSVAEFRALLDRPKPAPVGSLLIRVSPSQTAVRLQGPGFQQVVRGDADLADLPAGSYTLYAAAQGFVPEQKRVVLRPGERLEVRFDLQPIPSPTPPPDPTPTPVPDLQRSRAFHLLPPLALAWAALGYLMGSRLEGRPDLLTPLLGALERLYHTLFPNLGGFVWVEAGLYAAALLGLAYALLAFLTRLGCGVFLLVLGGLGLLAFLGVVSLEMALGLGVFIGGLGLLPVLLEHFSRAMAVILGLAAAFGWGQGGEPWWLGGLAVALLVVSLGSVVRFMKEVRP